MSGAFKGRREDLRLVTGQGRYTADWDLPGQAHGHFLRSDRAHAEIVSLDTSAAMACTRRARRVHGRGSGAGRLQEPAAAHVIFKGKDGSC